MLLVKKNCSSTTIQPPCSSPNMYSVDNSLGSLPDGELLSAVLLKGAGERSMSFALTTVAYLFKHGLERHEVLGNNAVSMLVEAGSMRDAQHLSVRLASRNEHSWNSLIDGYIDHGEPQQALLLFQKMQEEAVVQTSGYTYVNLLKACARLKDLTNASKIHRQILKSGLLKGDVFVGSSLVNMYVKCGSLEKAQDAFNNLPLRNAVSWNALISGYAKCNQGDEALNLFDKMQAQGVSPNAVTFICSLKACGSIENKSKGTELHVKIMRIGLMKSTMVVGNAIVDMYAKCGSLSKAQEVFETLARRDIVSWNALMGGYVKYERGLEALACFREMRADRVTPDGITFTCILKACGIIGDIEKGNEIHGEIASKGLLNRHLILGNALVDMYAKCGFLTKAQEVFDRLPTRDLVAWNALIGGFARHEHDEEAIVHLEEMQLEGISPDSITFACSLKACGSMGSLDKGIQIHSDIKRRGILEHDLLVGNALVSMYASCGLLPEAWVVFRKLRKRSVVSWNSLIVGHVEQDDGEEALNGLKGMQLEGVSPNAVTFASSLKACGIIRSVGEGMTLHAEVARNGMLERDLAVGSSLVEMYANCGLLWSAQEVFNKVLNRDLVLWNVLVAGYTECDCGEDALECIEKMESEGVMLDAVTFACSFKACGSIGDASRGLRFHAEVERRGLVERDLVAGNSLVGMYSKCSVLAKAREVLGRLPLRNIVSWSTMIAGYANNERSEEALDCYGEMLREGVLPDAISVACSLKACGTGGARRRGQEIHSDSARRGLLGDLIVSNALVDMYAKCGCIMLAAELFDVLPNRDVVSWNAWTAGCLRYNFNEIVLASLEQMQVEGVPPDAITLACCLKACGNLGAVGKGKEIHDEIIKEDPLGEDIAIGNALVDLYAKGGMLSEAQGAIDKLHNRNTISWNTLVGGYAQSGQSEHVFRVIRTMDEEGNKPDSTTFSGVLNACSHGGLLHEAYTCYVAMIKGYGITPTVEHLTSIVDVLGRAGQLERAVALMRNLPLHPDIVIASVVLGACRKWGNVSLGRQAFEDAMDLFQKDAAAYVSMYNIFADAEHKEDNPFFFAST